MTPTAQAQALTAELDWLERLIQARIRAHATATPLDLATLPPPDLGGSQAAYARFVMNEGCTPAERVLLALALAPHVRPQALDGFLTKNALLDRPFSEFGGVVPAHGGFSPSVETALFLLAGDDLAQRFTHQELFDSGHPFFHHGLLSLDPLATPAEPSGGRLLLAQEYLDAFTLGRVRRPPFGPAFPAKVITSPHEWDDLVLDRSVSEQIDEIRAWITHGPRLLDDWGLGRRLGRGYRCLFHGPPGTGKSMTAALLGKQAGRDVFRIDLSLVVSKYIGETEKNLESVFRHAEHLDCLLFFDEADALFGKRTSVGNAHDRYANQEVAYLLQRIEDFSGVVILATNLKTNIDEAFLRRFQTIVSFPLPRPAERLRLWRGAFSPSCALEPRIDLTDLSERYEIAGGGILNVVRYSSLRALERNTNEIQLADLQEGIRREFQKEGRTL